MCTAKVLIAHDRVFQKIVVVHVYYRNSSVTYGLQRIVMVYVYYRNSDGAFAPQKL